MPPAEPPLGRRASRLSPAFTTAAAKTGAGPALTSPGDDDPAPAEPWQAAGRRLRSLVASGALDLALPGSGRTWDRWEALSRLAAEDLSVARLAEGHADAVAVLAQFGLAQFGLAQFGLAQFGLAELGRPDSGGHGCLGVWAAGPSDAVQARPVAGGWRLSGIRRWCSGARTLDAALVTARAPDGDRLLLVELGSPGVRPIAGTWPAVGMAATDSLDVAFEEVEVEARAGVGPPGSYLSRPGFWHGAAGVAACWQGGALAVAERLEMAAAQRPDDHRLANLGTVDALLAASDAVLARTAQLIDQRPDDVTLARRVAMRARQVVHDGCWSVLERTGRSTGAGPLCHEPVHARRVADLEVYLRQHHGEADQAALGRLSVGQRPGGQP